MKNTTTCANCGNSYPDSEMMPINSGGELCQLCYVNLHDKWLNESLEEFNRIYGFNLGKRKYHSLNCPPNYNPNELVEFSDDGDAYPHSDWGTDHIVGAVIPFQKFLETFS